MTNIEHEVKLDAGPTVALPSMDGLVEGVSASSLPDQRLRAVYYDTVDLRLAREGVTLRRRTERSGPAEARSLWTLKLPVLSGAKGSERKELSWPGRHRAMPRMARSLVRAFSLDEPLGIVGVLVTDRRRVVVRGPEGGLLLEIDDDLVSVMEGSRIAARFREVEVEVVGPGGEKLLQPAVTRLRVAGVVHATGRPKLVRALGERAMERPEVWPVKLGPRSTVRELLGAALADGYRRLVVHDPGVRLDEDPEHVHQARVATRRLRSDLHAMRPLVDASWLLRASPELGWLGKVLGHVRDIDVLSLRIEVGMGMLDERDRNLARPLLANLASERRVRRRELASAMDSSRYTELLGMLAGASLNPPVADRWELSARVMAECRDEKPLPDMAIPVAEAALPRSAPLAAEEGAFAHDVPAGEIPGNDVVGWIAASAWNRLSRRVGKLGTEPSDADLHLVRIGAKRLRYACEVAAPVAGKQASRLAVKAAALQDLLGAGRDALMAEQWLRAAARSAPRDRALVIGQMIAFERASQREARELWPVLWERAQLRVRRDRGWLRPGR